MNEIICPNCKTAFKVDEAGFADILKQVRDREFDKELSNRLALAEKEKQSAVELAVANMKNALQNELAQKDKQLTELKAQSDAQLAEKLAQKEIEISEMESKIKHAQTEKENAVKLAEATVRNALQEEVTEKEKQLEALKAHMQHVQMQKQLELTQATKAIEKERDDLKHALEIKQTEKELLEKSIKEKFSSQLAVKDQTIRMKEDEIERLKDYKQKLSTKMVGESLEQHCEVEFNRLRATGFQNAYFEKDNDATGGTKGDYIYRETDEEGNEIISIMFEMKNENDETATKKRNEDFFSKLDKDRRNKGCEYAVFGLFVRSR